MFVYLGLKVVEDLVISFNFGSRILLHILEDKLSVANPANVSPQRLPFVLNGEEPSLIQTDLTYTVSTELTIDIRICWVTSI